jgi:hypothetical protein
MKITTAVSFILAGSVIFLIAETQKPSSSLAEIALPPLLLLLFLIMGGLLASSILNLRLGIEDLFVRESSGAIRTFIPGRPSIPTMFNFLLIASAGTLALFNPARLPQALKNIGCLTALIAFGPILGYTLGIEKLTYEVKNFNTPMALHTAIFFVLGGLSLFLIGRFNKSPPPGREE